ncbi:MAG: nucleotidyl transferase AbiEii/AbiGii toxin family protein [Bacteroidales bacterium]|nr:nucleotidyl transferase AbiEii/AbiGii toxin family protein [Bacteroidales bacterium]
MIPANEIKAWSNIVSWINDEQIEQDLVLSRSLVEIFSNGFLCENLAFRGGTAIHKLYLNPQPRYSEDIDLVQIKAGPIKEIIVQLQKCLSFLGTSTVKQKANNNTLIYRFNSESVTPVLLRLKIEINCREHFTVLGYTTKKFSVNSGWFKGSCNIQTYHLEEMTGTKVRALYQRKKGRDLYDIYKALTLSNVNIEQIIKCYRAYMKHVVNNPPTQKQYLQNIELKIKDSDFLGDTKSLLRPGEKYNPEEAWELVKTKLIEKI